MEILCSALNKIGVDASEYDSRNFLFNKVNNGAIATTELTANSRKSEKNSNNKN